MRRFEVISSRLGNVGLTLDEADLGGRNVDALIQGGFLREIDHNEPTIPEPVPAESPPED